MYKLRTSNKFEKDVVKCAKRNYDLDALETVLTFLEQSGELPAKYKPHKVSGNYKNYWECHVKPDWLIIWQQNNKTRVIELVRTGTHSEPFK